MKSFKHQHIFFGLVVGLLVTFLLVGGNSRLANAATGNTTGSAWGGTGSADGAYKGIGSISMSGSTGDGGSYGVTIPSTDGSLSGYAWSPYYGWLNFAGVTRSGSALKGAGEFLAISHNNGSTGGWGGSVSFSGSNYGVTISGNTLSGYAWSSELGWIDFSGVTTSASAGPTVRIQFF